MIFSSIPCNRKIVDVGSEPAPKADNLTIDLTSFFFASLIKLEDISVILGIGIVSGEAFRSRGFSVKDIDV
jgi:hypothetical protein